MRPRVAPERGMDKSCMRGDARMPIAKSHWQRQRWESLRLENSPGKLLIQFWHLARSGSKPAIFSLLFLGQILSFSHSRPSTPQVTDGGDGQNSMSGSVRIGWRELNPPTEGTLLPMTTWLMRV